MSYNKQIHICTDCEDRHTAYFNVKCDSCNRELKWDIDPADYDLTDGFEKSTKYLQFEDTLHIVLQGGYAEYLDTSEVIGAEEIHILLCEDCADTFFEFNPWMIKHLPQYAQDKLERKGRNILLPFREIGYTVEECERDMRKMTGGERGCANPDDHLMSRFTGHMKEK